MVEAYTIYKLYKKQRRKGSSASWEDVIPTVFSIDGDGTMPEVIVKSNATECGYEGEDEPIYKWEDADYNDDFICDECETYNPSDPHDSPYYTEYLTIEALTDGSIRWTGSTSTNKVSYSINDGEWSKESSSVTVSFNSNDKIRFKGNCSPTDNGIGRFTGTTASFKVYGNIHSLLFSDDFVENDRMKAGSNYSGVTFYRLFYDTKVVDASNLILPAKTLVRHCYKEMFYYCTSLIKAPELPATTLAEGCYESMFNNCILLLKAPALLAKTLAESCYYKMFDYCTSLQEAPSILPATTLADSCYKMMFNYCTSLQEAPVLPAKTLAESCYEYMFYNCTSLLKAPVLPATTLANECYHYMFFNCDSLTKAPVLPAKTLAESCYEYMFSDCTALQEFPELPATTLAERCYWAMFRSCTSLTKAPVLPATTLASNCYGYMFYNCTSLTKAPVLPATTLAPYCYNNMFYNCKSLNEITTMQLDAPNSVSNSQTNWVYNVPSRGTIYLNNDITWGPTYNRGVNGIPYGWTIEKI